MPALLSHTDEAPLCRWCCTGTPFSTDVSDIQGQVTFLGVSPFDIPAYYTHYVSLFCPAQPICSAVVRSLLGDVRDVVICFCLYDIR